MLWKFVTFLALLLNHLAGRCMCVVWFANVNVFTIFLIISPYSKTLWEIILTVIQPVVEHTRVSMLWEQEPREFHLILGAFLERVQLLICILWGLSFLLIFHVTGLWSTLILQMNSFGFLFHLFEVVVTILCENYTPIKSFHGISSLLEFPQKRNSFHLIFYTVFSPE